MVSCPQPRKGSDPTATFPTHGEVPTPRLAAAYSADPDAPLGKSRDSSAAPLTEEDTRSAGPPIQRAAVSTTRERLARGAVLLLFIPMVLLAGLYIGASLTGGPTTSPPPALPHQPESPRAERLAPTRRETVSPGPTELPAAAKNPPPSPFVAQRSGMLPQSSEAIARFAPPPAPPPRLSPPNWSLQMTPGSLLTPAEAAELAARGDALIRAGETEAARRLYQRAALAGNGTAALRLGQTFDPAFRRRAHRHSPPSDLGQAVYWYRQAQDLGNVEVEPLLRRAEIAARSRWNGSIELPQRPVSREFLRRHHRLHHAE